MCGKIANSNFGPVEDSRDLRKAMRASGEMLGRKYWACAKTTKMVSLLEVRHSQRFSCCSSIWPSVAQATSAMACAARALNAACLGILDMAEHTKVSLPSASHLLFDVSCHKQASVPPAQ